MPEMKTILEGSTVSTASVVESLQEGEKTAKAARARAAPAAVKAGFCLDWKRHLRVFIRLTMKWSFEMGELFYGWSCQP